MYTVQGYMCTLPFKTPLEIVGLLEQEDIVHVVTCVHSFLQDWGLLACCYVKQSCRTCA